MKKNIILLGSLILSSVAYSQVGIDTQDPKATLDVVVTADKLNQPFGIIAPRVTGTQLRNAGGQFLEPQDGAIVYATSSAGTTTGRAKNVTQKGYYYYDWAIDNGSSQGLWVALKNAPAEYVEPWAVQGGTTPATTNSQAISQNASVAIGKSTAYNNTNQTMLDVAGAVRGGTGQSGVVGSNSAAFGNGAKATGTESFAIGNNTTASGVQSFAGGSNSSTASGSNSFAFGNGATAIANHAVAIGGGTVAPARSSITLGRYNVNTFKSVDITQNDAGDPIFQLGSGSDNTNRWNTVTSFYLPNSPGWLAIGQSAANTMPERSINNERLRVYGGVLSNESFVSDINTVTGASTDKLVVADATTGQLKTIAASSVNTAYQEPWVVQGGTTPATTNSQAISQNASVAIGKSTAYNSTNQTMLDVAGAVRGGTGQSGIVGSNSAAFGNGTIASGTESFASGLNTTSSGSQSFAVGNANTASGNGSFAGGYYVTSGATASGQSAFAFGANGTAATANYSLAIGNNAKANGVSSFAFGNGTTASNTGSLAFGNGNTVSADYGVTIGLNNKASGIYAVALGQGTTASGLGSFSGGYFSSETSLGSTASGLASFAFGSNGTKATGDFSLAFGNNSNSVGANSFALGLGATALFNHSVAIGLGTNAPVRSGVVLGRYNKYTGANYTIGSNLNNIAGDPIFQVGQGSSDGIGRSNLITGYYGNNIDGSFSNGWVVIGADPTTLESIRLGSERLTVYGAIASTGAINAGGAVNGPVSTYPDYVFQNYYSGNSTLNPNYKFSNLYETEKFIKENHHLPGVTSVNELEKTENGYSINIGATATQALEKVEELYLHTIEQQKQIDELKDTVKQQQEQIKALLSK